MAKSLFNREATSISFFILQQVILNFLYKFFIRSNKFYHYVECNISGPKHDSTIYLLIFENKGDAFLNPKVNWTMFSILQGWKTSSICEETISSKLTCKDLYSWSKQSWQSLLIIGKPSDTLRDYKYLYYYLKQNMRMMTTKERKWRGWSILIWTQKVSAMYFKLFIE